MEDERNTQQHQGGEQAQDQENEVKDRGLLDSLLGRNKHDDQEKKNQQAEEELATGMEKVTVAEPDHKEEGHEAAEKKDSLLAKLHRTSSSSSSVSTFVVKHDLLLAS
jgi:hypothetical protein